MELMAMLRGDKKTITTINGVQVLINTLPKQWFHSIINEEELNINVGDINKYLRNEYKMYLQFYPNSGPVIPYLMVNYLRNWQGWNLIPEYLKGNLTWIQFYEKFHMDLHKFITTVLQNWQKEAQADNSCSIRYCYKNSNAEEVEEETKEKESQELNPEGFAPYSLSIKCPPSTLNTIFFTNSEDDVVLKQHSEMPWQSLTTEQLIHWPFVEVSFVSNELSFIRRQASEYLRYLNYTPSENVSINSNLIEMAEIKNKLVERKCYTSRLLQLYMKELLDTLKLLKTLSKERLEEIETIFNHFILDVKDLDLNETIASNTLILFKLGKSRYIRNKKLGNSNEKSTQQEVDLKIGYCEFIIPKIQLILNYFNAVQSDKIGFCNINKMKLSVGKHKQFQLMCTILPKITYKCTFCNEFFSGESAKENILDHFCNLHKMEQKIRCIKCKMQFCFLTLASNRWEHKCYTNET